jgi:hypothetical protein
MSKPSNIQETAEVELSGKGVPPPSKDSAPKRRPSLIDQVKKRVSHVLDSSELRGAIGDNDAHKLAGEISVHFEDSKLEQQFRNQWRKKDIVSGFFGLVLFFYIYKAILINGGFLSVVENAVLSSIVCGTACTFLAITFTSDEIFHKYYDEILVGSTYLVVLGQILMNYFARVSTETYSVHDSCYAPSCPNLSPSNTVVGILFLSSTSFRLRFGPCAILTLLIVLTEEIFLNVGSGEVYALDVMDQSLAILMVVYGGLLTAHELEIIHRKSFVSKLKQGLSNKDVREKLEKTTYSCCPRLEKDTGKRRCCLQFREEKDTLDFLDKMRNERIENGVDLGPTISATVTAAFLFLLAYPGPIEYDGVSGEKIEVPASSKTFGLPDTSDYDWRVDFARSFWPLYTLIVLMVMMLLVMKYVRKKKLNACMVGNKENRRYGLILFVIAPVIFGSLWFHTILANQGKAIYYLNEYAPLNKTACLSQSEWMEIVSEASIDEAPFNEIVCNMTKSYNPALNVTCEPKEFEAITLFCNVFGLPSFTIFVLQTMALWLLPDMRYGTIAFSFVGVYFLVMVIIYIGPFAITLEILRIAPMVIGALICMYEQTLTRQESYILGFEEDDLVPPPNKSKFALAVRTVMNLNRGFS